MNTSLREILIVDDEPNNHRVYERTLESLELDFVKVFSGQQALSVAHKHDFFLILMDVQMPEMDGFETASLLLNHPKTSHIPIIFITAFDRDESFEFKGYASGAVDYLVKPINGEILKSKVNVFLELFQDKAKLEQACKVRQAVETELRLNKSNLERIVKERTHELQESLTELMDTQNKLVETEKMASLGRLVAGIAHELNTPLGICVTAASYLNGDSQKMQVTVNNGKTRKAHLDEFLSTTCQATSLILTNLERAAELISNFKLIAVDISSEKNREFNLYDYIESTIISLRPALKHTEINVKVMGDSQILINTCPGSISQIITNLLMNSLLHAFEESLTGNITIELSLKDNRIHLQYQDDGLGMSEEVRVLIFEPFFTTKHLAGGSGLGLSIIYNLVMHKLRGDIKCYSKPNQGTRFEIMLPINIP